MPNDVQPRLRRRALLARLGVALAALVVTAGAIEVAARVRTRLFAKPHDPAEIEREWNSVVGTVIATTQQQGFVGEATDVDKPRPVLHPYVGWDWTHLREMVADELARFENGAAENVFDVLLVGGSVAASLGNKAGSRLVQQLEADPRLAGKSVRIYNHGRGGFKQPQQALWVDYVLILGYEPDLVIEIDGFNELALSADNAMRGGHPDHPSIGHWAHMTGSGAADREILDAALVVRETQRDTERMLDRARAWKLNHSAVAGPLVTRALKRARSRFVAAHEQYLQRLTKGGSADQEYTVAGPRFEGGLDQALDLSVRAWREGSRSIWALCRARSIRYLHVLQPTLHDLGSKPLTNAELASGGLAPHWIDAVRKGYPRLREEGAGLAAEGLDFLDASRLFEHVNTTLYYDGCHFSLEGNELFADAITTTILAMLDQPLAAPSREPGRPATQSGDVR